MSRPNWGEASSAPSADYVHCMTTGDTEPREDSPMLFHLAEPAQWAAAQATGVYEWSTRGRTLVDEGFIHASTADQWPRVRAAFYADITGPLVLLHIDPTRLAVPIRWEVGNPATGERFPHLYGPLPVAAVVGTTELAPPHGPGL